MIKIDEKKNCCGCGACMNVCPKHCITMRSDSEGFLYPEVNTEHCVECGLCEMVCPVKHVEPDSPSEQKAYLVQIKDEAIRRESTSGGAFTAIAQYVIKQQGTVFGVAYDEQFRVGHISATIEEDLAKYRNSKYVQSDTRQTFSEVENLLKAGKLVCYSGTPCQIEGLKRFLRKDFDSLITIDVVCHAVPSPLIWQKYLEMQQEKYGTDISNVLFRDKHYGYKYSTMTIKGKDNQNLYTYGIDTDPMLRAFFSDICDRPSCYDCKFKKQYRVSDFTIWDCYTVHNFDKSLDDDKGTTRVLIHSKRGQEVFEKIKNRVRFTEVAPEQLTAGVKEMFKSVSSNPNRDQFFIDANRKTGSELFQQYFPRTIKVRLERMIRVTCYKVGIYNVMKRIAKAILKK